jgi:hypothetical protein
MTSLALYPVDMPALAIAALATTPVGDRAGQVAWSTTSLCLIQWTGTVWAPLPFSSAPASVGASTYTVGAADHDLIFSVACTVTLPSAANFKGRELYVKSIAAVAIVSNASNVKPLATNSAGTAILAATAGKWARLVSDGANWVIMSAA